MNDNLENNQPPREKRVLRKRADALWKRFLRKMRAIVIAGLVVTVPIGLTIWILAWLFERIDELLQPVIEAIFGRPIPGVGFGVIVVLILIVGVIATNVIGRRIVRWAESMLGKVPVVRRLYVALKEVFRSFSDGETTGFMQVVLVEFPTKGMWSVGFITNETVDEAGHKIITVFIPHAPNPMTGFVEIVHEEDIIRTSVPVEEALKMVVSGGRMFPKELSEAVYGKKTTSGVAK